MTAQQLASGVEDFDVVIAQMHGDFVAGGGGSSPFESSSGILLYPRYDAGSVLPALPKADAPIRVTVPNVRAEL
jgi:hypothetical protein